MDRYLAAAITALSHCAKKLTHVIGNLLNISVEAQLKAWAEGKAKLIQEEYRHKLAIKKAGNHIKEKSFNERLQEVQNENTRSILQKAHGYFVNSVHIVLL